MKSPSLVCDVRTHKGWYITTVSFLKRFIYNIENLFYTLARESLRQLLVEATVAVQREDITTNVLEEWLEDQKELSIGMVEMAISQV